MLRKIRVIISVVLFALITFYFLDFADILPNSFHRLAHIQFVPAFLSLSLGILVFLIVLTLIFGRIYCSSICPMGIFQDMVAWISKVTSKKKKRYSYSPAKNILRWSIVGIATLATLMGFTFILALLDPYSAYGRIVTNVFKPVYMSGNNLLESVFSRFENYTFYQVDVAILSVASFVIALVTFCIIFYLAWKHGRTWCNTICPVGTLLGFVGRFSIFKVRIDFERCNGCGQCATKCKAVCINSKEHAIDYSRCVDCFDCLEACNKHALVFAPSLSSLRRQEKSDASKRRFLVAGAMAATTLPKALAQVKEASASLEGKKSHKRENPITPPGSISRDHFVQHCTSCHLCVSKCPSHVLKPAFTEYGLAGIMQPTVYFEKGFCNFDCTVCGDVCPNGAIKPLTIEQKHLTQMGHVVFIKENCIVLTDGTSCGACSEHCPTQAIAMVPYKGGLTIPEINTDICVGCGGCEYVCPARPFRAVYIEGNPVQKEAKPFKETEQEKVDIDDFGF
ncbi:4Fe-4S dicluster domain-containing protein [Oscillospiraceae bacterium N12]|mgnify:CR=1 FL=1|uniref:4Fe-4S dicluster domain-containing protein n=1 Tax=Jilunia laotingensis TaxID=2763675 RepID=A0A926ISA1_9BACT|nr:4Fe-4S binding protein [Jilunia laotingensis]MBC8594523.1 4Fe-4S dicluster domain-containing protein [Jilunia laotingensis]